MPRRVKEEVALGLQLPKRLPRRQALEPCQRWSIGPCNPNNPNRVGERQSEKQPDGAKLVVPYLWPSYLP